MLNIEVDRGSKIPCYIQIRDSIIHLIDVNVLKEGMRLPASRVLAGDLGVNRSTITRAYGELWSLGFLESSSGSYSYVRKRPELNVPEEDRSGKPRWVNELTEMKEIDIPASDKRVLYDFRPLSLDPGVIPSEDFRKCLNDVLKEKGTDLLGYGPPSGDPGLIAYIGDMMCRNRLRASNREICITTGAQNALDLICRIFGRPGWSVIVEEPCYSVALDLFRWNGAEIIPCSMGEDGICLDTLSHLVETKKPSFVYIMPNYQNPTGYSYSQPVREGLLKLCEEMGIPIVEDGFSEDMRGTIYPVKSMDCFHNVIYLGTFSKIMLPGIRIGWIYAHPDLISKIAGLQYISSIFGNIPVQAALERFCRLGLYDTHLRRVQQLYRKRMDIALSVLAEYFPVDCGCYSRPKGGYTLWIGLDKALGKEKEIYDRLIDGGVAIIPGKKNYTRNFGENHFRISLAQRSEDEIEKGLQRMCRILKKRKENNTDE